MYLSEVVAQDSICYQQSSVQIDTMSDTVHIDSGPRISDCYILDRNDTLLLYPKDTIPFSLLVFSRYFGPFPPTGWPHQVCP